MARRNGETLIAEFIGGDPPRERQKEALRSAFSDMSWEVPETLDGMDEVEDSYFDRVSQIQLPRWSSERVGLVGDASAYASLFAGEGTGLAMIEAYVLAGELHRANGDLTRGFALHVATWSRSLPRRHLLYSFAAA